MSEVESISSGESPKSSIASEISAVFVFKPSGVSLPTSKVIETVSLDPTVTLAIVIVA